MGALDDYLAVLTGDGQADGWLELRYRHAGGMRTRFYSSRGDSSALVPRVAHHAPKTDVYVGCALRSVQRGDRAAFGEAWALWAECDTPEASARLGGFDPPPSLVIASGSAGHTHGYWALDRPIFDAGELEHANRRLAVALGADMACCDAVRILRPPGTLNHKRQPPAAVEQVTPWFTAIYAIEEILEAVPDTLPGPPNPGVEARIGAEDRLLAIEPARYVPVLLGAPVGRDHKVSCPWHEDRTPSLHVYDTPERGWFCFSCRVGGSVYDMAARQWQLATRGSDFVELRRRLLELFA